MIITRYSMALMSAFALLGAMTGRADDGLPPHFKLGRYSAMVDHSPFAIATAVALPAPTPDFAKDLYVANVAHSPGGDMVTIASSSDQKFKKYLTTREPVDGYSITHIEWSDKVGATKVTISKDGNFATLKFNEALLSQRAAPNAPPAPAQMPQSMPPPQTMPQMPSSDALQAPGPGVPGVNQKKLKPGAVPRSQQQQQDNERAAARQRKLKAASKRP